MDPPKIPSVAPSATSSRTKGNDGSKDGLASLQSTAAGPPPAKAQAPIRFSSGSKLLPAGYRESHVFRDKDGIERFPCAVRYPQACNKVFVRTDNHTNHLKTAGDHAGQIFADNGDGWLKVVGILEERPERFNYELQRVLNPSLPHEMEMILKRQSENGLTVSIGDMGESSTIRPTQQAQGLGQYTQISGPSTNLGHGHAFSSQQTQQPDTTTTPSTSARPPPQTGPEPRDNGDEDGDQDPNDKPLNGGATLIAIYKDARPLATRIRLYYTNLTTGQEVAEVVQGILDPSAGISTISLSFCRHRGILIEQLKAVEVSNRVPGDINTPPPTLSTGALLAVDVHDSYGEFVLDRVAFWGDEQVRRDALDDEIVVVLGYDWAGGKAIDRDMTKGVWRYGERMSTEGQRRGKELRLGWKKVVGTVVVPGEGEVEMLDRPVDEGSRDDADAKLAARIQDERYKRLNARVEAAIRERDAYLAKMKASGGGGGEERGGSGWD